MSKAASACRFNRAIVRLPGESVINGLRAGSGENPSYTGVCNEHQAYIAALQAAGVEVQILEALEAFPDSVFVEDPALVFPGAAILLRPGTAARGGETAAIQDALEQQFECIYAIPPGCFVEGGDVLVTPSKVMIGLSSRTNIDGADALGKILEKLGRSLEIVTTPPAVLHFKSDCGLLDDETVLATEQLAKTGVFKGFDQIITPVGEEAAANALRINNIVLLSDQCPRTAETLDRRGYTVAPLSTTEIGKIDAGLSCMSLRWLD